MSTAIGSADNDIKGKVKGYILCATPNSNTENLKDVIFIKKANPIIEVKNKRSMLFTMDEDDNLNNFSDKAFRFYLTTDCLMINNVLYTFNLNFEEIFSLDKTLNKLKGESLNLLKSENLFCTKMIHLNF